MYFFIKQVDGSMNAGGVVVEGGEGLIIRSLQYPCFVVPSGSALSCDGICQWRRFDVPNSKSKKV